MRLQIRRLREVLKVINTNFMILIGIFPFSTDWSKSAKGGTSIDDTPQLEYDERGIQLIADRGK